MLAGALTVPLAALIKWPSPSRVVKASPAVLRRLDIERHGAKHQRRRRRGRRAASAASDEQNTDASAPGTRAGATHAHGDEDDDDDDDEVTELRARVHETLFRSQRGSSTLSATTVEELATAIDLYERLQTRDTNRGQRRRPHRNGDDGDDGDDCDGKDKDVLARPRPTEPPTPGGTVPSTATVVSAWRKQLRQLLLVALERATQMQSFGEITRLLRVHQQLRSHSSGNPVGAHCNGGDDGGVAAGAVETSTVKSAQVKETSSVCASLSLSSS